MDKLWNVGETNISILKMDTICPSEDCFEDQVRECTWRSSADPHAANAHPVSEVLLIGHTPVTSGTLAALPSGSDCVNGRDRRRTTR